MEPKGAWKHCWERVGDPVEVLGPDKRRRYDQKYVCRTCGASVVGRCSGKVKTSVWRKQGVKTCDVEMVERVHAL